MNEVLAQLFSGDQAADIAFWIIVGLSFLLGMLLFALLAYWPAKRRLNKELERARKENELLTRDHKDLSERFTAINTQYKRVQEDWQMANNKLKEQEGLVSRQVREIKYLKEELEAHKAQARNYKQANDKLLEQYQKAAKSNEAQQHKLEALKDLVEEVEQEQLQEKYRKSQREEDQAKRQLQQLQVGEQEWRDKNAQLAQDLSAALQQRAELKQLLQQLEEQQQVGSSTDEELRQQVLDIKRHLKALETENAELMQRLAPYLAQQQQDQQDSEALEPLLVDLLIEAEESLKDDGFFVAYTEEELVEDPQQLARTLAELQHVDDQATEVAAQELTLDQEDEESLERSLSQAGLAMQRQGFYENMHEAVLVPLSEKIQNLSHEELLNERLQDTAAILEASTFYNKEALEDNLVEQEELLAIELAKLDVVPTTRGAAAIDPIITISKEEAQDLEAADDLAQEALQQPGLYAPIEAAQLLADKKYEETVHNLEEFSEQRRLEGLVTQEIGRAIPKARAEDRDPLQEIDGIGQFMEQQLNQLGIYTYEQISLFDNVFINTLSAALDFPATVIYEKEWVAQAKNKLTKP